MKKGWMYILRCANNTLYVGSTNDLVSRFNQHNRGEGANFTRARLPCELVYHEEYQAVKAAYFREQQIHKWSRAKKEALIKGFTVELHALAACRNLTHFLNFRELNEPSGQG